MLPVIGGARFAQLFVQHQHAANFDDRVDSLAATTCAPRDRLANGFPLWLCYARALAENTTCN
jgi:hypothetical protein